MYTQCPFCQTCFRIAEAHLKAAKGKVRCGSCKEIFDATDHLYDGIPASDNKITPPSQKPTTPPPVVSPGKPLSDAPTEPPPRYNEILPGGPEIPEHDHEHIDLSVPPDRSNVPDQSQFMESIVGDYSRYNNLDEMGSIKIPGAADFSDSFIKFAEEEKDVDEDIEPAPSEEEITESKEEIAITNPYADIESQEAPSTTAERDGISALYSAADSQMFEEDTKEQLDKDIEALLADDFDFDDDLTQEPLTRTPADDAKTKKVVEEPSSFSGLDSIQFNADANIPLKTGEEPKLVLDEGEVEPLDIVSSDDIWANKNPPEKTEPAIDNFLHDDEPEPEEEPAISKADFDESFLDLESEDFKSHEEIDFEDFASPADAKPEIKIESKPERVKPSAPQDVDDDLPSFEHDIPKALRSSFENFDAPMRPVGLTIAMIAGIIVLIVGLLGQAIIFRSYQLANQMPSLTPTLTSLCSFLPCRYSGSIDVSKIEVINRDMRSHPSQKNALLVSTAFVNKASFDQPYPVIAIKLFDLSGDTVATRYFKPEEYLENLYSDFLLMESGTPVHITLAVLDPGDDAVNFEFSFQ